MKAGEKWSSQLISKLSNRKEEAWKNQGFNFGVGGARATTAQLYPGRDTFEFYQEHVTKNQPITVLNLLSESLAI